MDQRFGGFSLQIGEWAFFQYDTISFFVHEGGFRVGVHFLEPLYRLSLPNSVLSPNILRIWWKPRHPSSVYDHEYTISNPLLA